MYLRHYIQKFIKNSLFFYYFESVYNKLITLKGDFMGSYGALCGSMGSYGVLMGLYGALWGHYGVLWGFMEAYGGFMGLYAVLMGPLWGPMGAADRKQRCTPGLRLKVFNHFSRIQIRFQQKLFWGSQEFTY